MIAVLPLTKTTVNWNQFLKETQSILGRSVTKELDKRRIKINNLSSFIVALAEMKKESTDPATVLRNPGHLDGAIYFGFMVGCDRSMAVSLLEKTRLSVIITDIDNLCLVVLTGNLSQWKTAIVDCSIKDSDLLGVMNKCQMHIEKEGFNQLWSSYGKQSVGQLFYLQRL